jgi:hypothetical protein
VSSTHHLSLDPGQVDSNKPRPIIEVSEKQKMAGDAFIIEHVGQHHDVVQISLGGVVVVRDVTLDALDGGASTQLLVAVQCGRNFDGILLYGFSYGHSAMPVCKGVVRFVPVDSPLQVAFAQDEGNGIAKIGVITGYYKDVCTLFRWYADSEKWYVFSNWYTGYQNASIEVPFGTTVPTQNGGEPTYFASYLPLRG